MPTVTGTLNILWLLAIDHPYHVRHGGTLRYVNFSKGLTSLGHRVYYLVRNSHAEDRTARNLFLDRLRKENVLTDYFEIDTCRGPRWRAKLARLLVHPRGKKWVMSPVWMPYKREVLSLVDRCGIDLCILSDRYGLFLLPELARRTPTVVDWCDSFVLAGLRNIRVQLRSHQIGPIPAAVRNLVNEFMNERFYGRNSGCNVIASPADKRCMDAINRRPHANRVLLNGVSFLGGDGMDVQKIPGRLIFSGTMSFPPNYQGALWFIKRVMPSLEQVRSDVHFVIAGQEPCSELYGAARRNVIVTGLVADLRQEIAKSRLYVAPLISGSGFKNKIVEALASGTFVVATRIAVESLGEELQKLLLVADSERDLAREILQYLNDPDRFHERLLEARRIVRTEFAWERRVEQLLAICREMISEAPMRE